MIEHTEARYEVQEVEMGEVYTRRLESIVVECDCGERPTLTASMTTCDLRSDDYIELGPIRDPGPWLWYTK